jgi:hypothetical protein
MQMKTIAAYDVKWYRYRNINDKMYHGVIKDMIKSQAVNIKYSMKKLFYQ